MTADIVELATDAELRRAADVLARAFHDDPIVQYIYPGVRERLSWLRAVFEIQTRIGQAYGKVCATRDMGGVAVWIAPENVDQIVRPYVRGGGLKLLFISSPGAMVRGIRFLRYARRMHGNVVSEPHWYLPFLGVMPGRQGEGLGARLMRSVLKQTDAAALSCYLETANQRTIALYEREGFTVVMEGDLVVGGPHLWAMLRSPGRA